MVPVRMVCTMTLKKTKTKLLLIPALLDTQTTTLGYCRRSRKCNGLDQVTIPNWMQSEKLQEWLRVRPIMLFAGLIQSITNTSKDSRKKQIIFILTMSVRQTCANQTVLTAWTVEQELPWASFQESRSSLFFFSTWPAAGADKQHIISWMINKSPTRNLYQNLKNKTQIASTEANKNDSVRNEK